MTHKTPERIAFFLFSQTEEVSSGSTIAKRQNAESGNIHKESSPNLQKIGVWDLNDYIGEVFFVNLNYSQFSTGPRDYEIEKITRRWTNILNCIERGRKQDIIVKEGWGSKGVNVLFDSENSFFDAGGHTWNVHNDRTVRLGCTFAFAVVDAWLPICAIKDTVREVL